MTTINTDATSNREVLWGFWMQSPLWKPAMALFLPLQEMKNETM